MGGYKQRKAGGPVMIGLPSKPDDGISRCQELNRQMSALAPIFEAKEELMTTSLPDERGPYADNTSKTLARFVRRHFHRNEEAWEIGNRVTEHMRDSRLFSINDRILIPNRLPIAGEILSQTDERLVRDEDGRATFAFIDMLELMAVSTAVLRRRGFGESYPTFLAFDEGGGKTTLDGAISLFDTAHADRLDFLLLRFSDQQPEPDLMVMIGDEAMMGALSAILALGRANRFIDSFSAALAEGRSFKKETTDAEMRYIAEALADCESAWPDCFYTQEVLSKLETGLKTELILKNVSHPATISEEVCSMAHGHLVRFIDMAENGYLGFKSS